MVDKNKKHQFTVIFALSLVLILLLAACGGQSGNTATYNTVNQPNTENEMAENTTADNTASEDTANNAAGNEASSDETANSDASAESSDSSDAASTYSYAADVFPIFNSRCANCHGGERTEGGFIILSYDQMMAGGEHGTVIVPGDAGSSKLVQLVESGKMPKRGPKVTPVEIEIISTWINEGAPNN